MENQEKGAKSSLFLIELIIVLFFFLLVASICVQAFAKAHNLSRASRELSHAQSQCSSVSEVLTGTAGTMELLSQYFPEGTIKDGTFCIFYDKDFAACDAAESVYTLTVTDMSYDDWTLQSGDIHRAEIEFSRGEEVIYSLPVRWYIPLAAGGEAGL